MTVSELVTDKTFDETVQAAVDGLNGPYYPLEKDSEDGTMDENRDELAKLVVGHKIVDFEKTGDSGTITLDNGKKVKLAGTSSCCAYTELETFLLNHDKIDHVITGVGTTNDFHVWHIYADMGDVLRLTVGWSGGSGYYGYGFDITVEDDDAS